jgi:hypothetical protein
LNYFETPNEFIRAVKKAKKVKITRSVDNEIYGRSQTTSYEELLSLIKNYRSYPKYRNQKTLKAIYDGFKKGRPMDMPIVLKDKHGDMKIFSGNTRMDISFQLGINPTVIILEVDEI